MENPFGEVEILQTEKEKTYEPFKQALMNGQVDFSYTKKDGTIRHAVGTTCPSLIPAEKQIQNSGKKEFDHIQNYFDLTIADGGDWRAFIKDNLIEFTPIQPLT